MSAIFRNRAFSKSFIRGSRRIISICTPNFRVCTSLKDREGFSYPSQRYQVRNCIVGVAAVTATAAVVCVGSDSNNSSKVCQCDMKSESHDSLSKPSNHVDVDLLIVGAGSAGLTAAKFASVGEGGLGHSVALKKNFPKKIFG